VADSAVTPYVFLDTEVFKGHNLDFRSPNIRRLVRLAAEEVVRVLLTTVTKGEVMDDLDERAREAIKQLKEVRRLASTMRKIMPGLAVDAVEEVERDGAIATLKKEFDDFIAETRATVLDLSSVDADAIFKKYFEGTPPFGGDKKSRKVEFPDAFAFAALEAWSRVQRNTKVYVVGADGDWKKMCEGHPNLIRVPTLEELLQHYTDSEVGFVIRKGLEAQRDKLLELVRAEAENMDVYVGGDMLIDGEIGSFEILDVEIEEFNVVEIKDGEASVSVVCQVSVGADVVADDPDSGVYDHETKDMHYIFRLAGTVARTVEKTAEVKVQYDEENAEVIIESVDFEDNGMELFVEEQELERVDDNDCSDDAMEYQQHLHEQEMEYQQHLMENVEPPDHEEL